ncbi:MarR family winged helix-turn-helix transcriptional regulator [Amycolatopsis sp. YIM 10]|uniref:MarR family winged helix-turn-helix transcriptional regulator n=1 Tax=Amycolatopsis sp. YIM 10 TaxID=2653857 RepID=UPI00128FE6C2|nr:MarR family winged helix-turn-helix transcriptional regulator [Amycolatopsis sp. YIM 10]QFU86572.1 transcriptional repressor MprA [Amycolatopsis sp. YIM 10]
MAVGELPALLALTFRAIMDGIHEQLAAEGFDDVRPAHGFAFQFLSHRPDGATAVELGEHLGVTKQAAVQLAEELEKRGYLQRRPHPVDRRSRLISLAPRGWACIERVVALSRAAEAHWAGLIGEDRIEQLSADLHAFVRDAATRRPVTLRPVW